MIVIVKRRERTGNVNGYDWLRAVQHGQQLLVLS
jgi:hypothetical protein